MIVFLFSSCAEQDGFNAELAEKLGADDYGMKQYVMAFLYEGENRELDPEAEKELMQGHMANITRMAEEGSLVLAGPSLGEGELRGIYTFDVKTVEEARELTGTDPAIQGDYLRMELKPWYGSATLLEINEMHNIISKVKI